MPLTHQQIDEMPAGPEMDEMVALAIGWKRPRILLDDRAPFPIPAGESWSYSDPPESVVRWREDYHWVDPRGACWNDLPRLSSAHELVHRDEVLRMWPGDYLIRRQNDQFKVELFRPSEEFEAWGETVALASCRARLHAALRDGQI